MDRRPDRRVRVIGPVVARNSTGRWAFRSAVIGAAVCAVALAGCSYGTLVEVDTSGDTTVVQRFSVSKTTVDFISSLQDWNEFVREAMNAEDPRLPTPLPGAECSTAEEAFAWTLTCASESDLTVFPTIGVRAYRIGSSLFVRTLPSELEEQAEGFEPLTVSVTLTLPGRVTSISGSASVDSDDTATLQMDVEDESMAVFELDTVAAIAPNVQVELSPPAMHSGPSRSWVTSLTALINGGSGIDGRLTAVVCPPDTSVSTCPVAGTGEVVDGVLAEPIPVTIPAGKHTVFAFFDADDWLAYERSHASVEVTARSFRLAGTPRVLGEVEVGDRVSAAPGRVTPEPTAIRYRWLREMVSASGETVLIRIPRATRRTYTVTVADRGYRLVAQMHLTRAGLPVRLVTARSAVIR